MPTRHLFSTGTIHLSYLAWGTPEGVPLLLLHGLADHAGVWAALGEALSPQCAVVAPDLRGHGQSSKPATGYRFTDHIHDLNALMDDLGWGRAHVLGHSWGGKLACVWATRQPERFKSVMLIDPFFNGTLPGWMKVTFPIFYRVLPFLKTMGPFASYKEAETLAKSLKQYRGWSAFQQQVFVDSVEEKSDGTWGNRLAIAARNEIFEDVMRVAGVSRPVDLPALFIKPQKGLNRTALQLAPYRKYLTNLHLIDVPGNHWAHLVEPEAVHGVIAHFLSEQLSEQSASSASSADSCEGSPFGKRNTQV